MADDDDIRYMNSLIPDRDPNLEYGSILPFAVDRTTDETYFAYPEFVRDLVSVFETPARVARGEIQNMDELRRAAADVALNYTPAGGLAGIATGTRGLAMGAARSEADKSSTGLSGLRWYRGTANPSELNVVSGGKEGTLGGGGVYLTPDPESASRYASETITGAPKTGGFVLPLTAKFDNPLIVELNKEKGYFAEGRVLEELGMNREKAFDKAEQALDTKGSLTNEVKSKAIKAGYDGVILVRDGELQEAISYRPEDIRSIFEGGTKATDDIIDNLDFEPDDIGKAVETKSASDAPKQAISSADTSLRQVPALFKKQNIDFPEGGTNFDIGGGRFDEGTKYLADERGVENFVYDPYNRSPEHNAAVIDRMRTEAADTATAANVLNVIAEPEARADVIRQAIQNIKPGGTAYFQIYEGAGTGVGKVTSKGFQNNKKTADYIGEVEEIFGPDNVRRKGNVIIATKPVEYRRGGSVVERSNNYEPKAI